MAIKSVNCLTLTNSGGSVPETNYFNNFSNGQLWDVDQQCKISTGLANSQATNCGVRYSFESFSFSYLNIF